MNFPPHNSRTFDYWGSIADTLVKFPRKPTAYDILSCINSDASCPETADDVYAVFGDMNPSRAEQIARASREWQQFFTCKELVALSEIR